jgi:proteasome lid subunit RPN8/RPN11
VTETLTLTPQLVDDMVTHLEAERPNEGCGILAARDGVLVRVVPMVNAARSPILYSLDPKEQLAVYRKLDEEGLDLGGIFHSHTHTDAFPSATDVRLASEDVPLVIVSLASRPPSIRAFRVVKDFWYEPKGEIEEIPVAVTA